MTQIPVRRALISVYDKAGLLDLARGLHEAGVQLVSTGSTATTIAEADIPVIPVAEVTGFPEILGGRVKTLHPHVHAGLLADQGNPEHLATIGELGIETFQLVVANLYPFRETVAAGAGAGRDRRADRHRRSGHGARGGQEPRIGGDRGGSGQLRRRAHRGCQRWVRPAGPAAAGRPGVRAHRRLRRGGGELVRRAVDAGRGGSGHRARRCDGLPALRRHGTGAGRGAAVRGEPAPARRAVHPAGCAARHRAGGSAARQGDELQQLRRRRRRVPGRVRLRRAVRGDHQARQPVRHRHRRRHRRGAPQGTRLRSGLGVRRGDRLQSAGQPGTGRAGQGHLHRGGARAGLRRRCPGSADRQQEPAIAGDSRPPTARHRAAADLRRPAAAGRRRGGSAGR